MPKITIENLNKKSLEVIEPSKTLLQNFHAHGLDWMYACGGKGRCTTCKVSVLLGIANFWPLTEAEMKYRSQGLLLVNERLSCQAGINGDAIITVPETCKLPHIKYSD